jgi:cell pole-organizing protein PopZ
MSDDDKREERSMSEILSSIRRIVTDEEKTRREADEQRREHEAESGASVFVLTDEMRVGDAAAAPKPSVDFDEPLELEPETSPFVLDQADEPAPEAAPEQPQEDPVYAAAPVYSADTADPLDLVDPIAPAAAEPMTPMAEEMATPAAGVSDADLEEIVRRVVRDELKGPTGQQITRKLKRVIRDEIARAMEQEDDGLI